MLNFTKEVDANDMQSMLVKFFIPCSKQTNDIFECLKLHPKRREPNESPDSFVATLPDRISKCKFCNTCAESVLRDHIGFGIKNDGKTRKLVRMRDSLPKRCVELCRDTDLVV